MDAKGIDRATLMGGSLGGHLAVLVALQQPARVDRLILMGACGAWPPPGILALIGLNTLWQDPIVVDHLRRKWPSIYRRIVSSQDPVAQRLFRYQMAVRADRKQYWAEGRAASRALKSIFYHSCRPGIPSVRQPTLLVWGENDRIHLLSEGLYYRQHLPDARLVVVPNSAHEVILDQPAAMVDLVLRFMTGGTEAIQDSPEVLASLTKED
jgi:pimeloyl-ACP methyl ester carboxylesterase